MRLVNPLVWRRLVAVATPFFRSEARRRAVLSLGLLIAMLVCITSLNWVNNYINGMCWTAFEQRRLDDFYRLALLWGCVFAALTTFEVFARFTEQSLALAWRDWLTRNFLDRYFAGGAYLRLTEHHDLDNPDQRISEDVRTFTTTTLSFLVLITNGLLTLVVFSGVLWSITPWLVVVALGYAASGSLGAILLGKRLVPLDNQQLRKEADFRYDLGQVRAHARDVAQSGGDGEEKARLRRRIVELIGNYTSIIRLNRTLGFFTSAYGYLPQLIPAAVVAPLFFRGEVGFGAVTRAAMAFSMVQGAFSLVVTRFQDLAAYVAVIGRLGTLWEATEPAAAPPLPPAPAANGFSAGHSLGPVVETAPDTHRVAFEHLTLKTPDGRSLVHDLSLEVAEGKRVVIAGPSGAGKTALLLATAGLWHTGNGRIVRPGPGGVMFLPQRPHTASGRLRDLLRYGLDGEFTDGRLLEALREVGLGESLGRKELLGVERDWEHDLSHGEQQAVAFARLLLGGPQFAFLDDVCEALEPSRVRHLYEALARSSIVYVSVEGHHDLAPYHDLRLELQGDGNWHLEPTGAGCRLAAGS